MSALIITTGMSRVSGLPLMILSTSSPFRSGIIMSSRTRLNFSVLSKLIASSPSSGAHYPLVTVRFEQQLQGVSVIIIVVDDKDARDISVHRMLKSFLIVRTLHTISSWDERSSIGGDRHRNSAAEDNVMGMLLRIRSAVWSPPGWRL